MKVCKSCPKIARAESSMATEATKRLRSIFAPRPMAAFEWNLASAVRRELTLVSPAGSRERTIGAWAAR